MCINFNGYHSGGSSFLIVNDCWLKKKKKKFKESQYMVSHPETGSDSPIGSDRDRGRDSTGWLSVIFIYLFILSLHVLGVF